MVKPVNGKYAVFSKSGRKLSRDYDTREQAEKRLREIEFFKNRGRR